MTEQLTSAVPGVRQRSVRIDIVRLLGLIVVVAGHVWTQYPIGGYVAVFFVLSGYWWSAKGSLAEDLRYQSWKLLVPYFAWLGILMLAPRWAYLGCLVAALAATVLDKQLLGGKPGAVNPGAVSVLFLAAGHAYRRIEARVGRFHAGAAGVVVLCGILAASGTSARMTLKSGDFGTPVLSIAVAILMALAAIVLARPLADALPEKAERIITRVVRIGIPSSCSTPFRCGCCRPVCRRSLSLPPPGLFRSASAVLLLRFPESMARRTLMPDKDHRLL